MKLFFSLLLPFLVDINDAYTPNSSNSKFALKKPSSSALGYIDGRVSSEVITVADLTFGIKQDDETTSLSNALGITELTIREEYDRWVMKYDRVPDESRYSTFKKNFLIQEDFNRKNGKSFQLNEFGDYTEGMYYL